MRKINKSIILVSILLIFLISISFVSATDTTNENSTNIQTKNNDLISNENNLINPDKDLSINEENIKNSDKKKSNPKNDILKEDEKPSEIYVNSSKEVSGDGSSWNEAYAGPTSWNDIHTDSSGNKIDNCIVYLANGHYTQNSSINYNKCTFIGQGENTIISFFADTGHNSNPKCTFINITFVKSINSEDNTAITADLYGSYDFLNCTFIDLPMCKKGWPSTTVANFRNCLFKDVNQTHLFYNEYYGYLRFYDCTFSNITAKSIISNGASGSVKIYNSNFKQFNVKGILKCDGELQDSLISNCTYDYYSNKAPVSSPLYFNNTNDLKVYVNTSREVSGDGSSWENAANHYTYYKGLTVYLSEGNYSISGFDYTIIGQKGTIIKSLPAYHSNSYLNFNRTMTFINITFDIKGTVHLYFNDFNFINCTFVNTSFISDAYQHNQPNRDGLTDIYTHYFENCKFLDYNPNQNENQKYLFSNFECSKFVFKNCLFENISCDAIVDSYGGNIDNYGRLDGAYIYDSTFKNCNINGIVKARQASYCVISNCKYDFPVTTDIPLVGPFYINSTNKLVIKTNLDLKVNDDNLIITLTDESNNPLIDVELEIISNGKLSYKYTDNKGQIILENLDGDYKFEISYPGDEYEGYTANSINKTLSFKKTEKNNGTENPTKQPDTTSQITTNLPTSTTSQKTTIKTKVIKLKSKITAKKVTFKSKTKVKKYKIILKADKKPIKNMKLTLKLNGKTYTAKTNTKGYATFKITKLTKKGTFKAKITFKGSKYYNPSSKKIQIKIK